MLRKKKQSIELVVENKDKPDKDNGKALIDQFNDPDFKKAMIKASSDSDIESTDPTKFTLLENLHNRETADFYTWWKNEKETELPNRLMSWQRLMPVVFGNSDKVKLCQSIVIEHVKDAMVNRASIKRARESALVYAVKQDTGLIQTDRQVQTFLKGGR